MDRTDQVIKLIQQFATVKNLNLKIKRVTSKNGDIIQIFTKDVEKVEKLVNLIEDVANIYIFNDNYNFRYLAD